MTELAHRLIPVLLLDRDRRLVKTEAFGRRTYIGDPLNVVRLFNEMEVDELCLLDIDATADGDGPDLGFLQEFASECFMPLAYGGGISAMQQAHNLNRIGIEKMIIGKNAVNSDLVRSLVADFGSQAIVACLDHDGQTVVSPKSCGSLTECARTLEQLGFGEIILQSSTLDGARTGYDLAVIKEVSSVTSVPIIALGGARDHSHLTDALRAGAAAAASGSAFSFVGNLRAVLVSYPTRAEHLRIIQNIGAS